jgi:hypothetical protein
VESAFEDGLARRAEPLEEGGGTIPEPELVEGGITANGRWNALPDDYKARAIEIGRTLQEQGIPGPYVAERRNGTLSVLPVATVLAGTREDAAAGFGSWAGPTVEAVTKSLDELAGAPAGRLEEPRDGGDDVGSG